MADAIQTYSVTRRDLIEARVQKELEFKAKLASMVTDVSMFAELGSKSISFPKLSSFTVVNRAAGAAGDATALTDSLDTMNLDQNAYVAWIIDSMSKAQTAINAELENAGRAAGAQARYVDTQIISQAEAVGVVEPSASGDITRDIVLEMIEQLELHDADMSMASFWISPTQKKAMLKVAEFTEAQIYGSSNVPNGVIGSVYGVPIVVSNALTALQYFCVEKSGLALGFQKGLSMDEQGANEFGVGAKRVAMDQLFGTKGLQLGVTNGKGIVPAAGESALVIKDANV